MGRCSRLLIAIAALLFAAIAPAHAAAVNARMYLKPQVVAPPAGAIGWSTYGVDPASSDNTTALNALPAGTALYCDTVGVIKATGQWLWKSHLTIYGLGCTVQLTFCPVGNVGVISQSDLTTALDTPFIDGLKFDRVTTACAGKTFFIWANHWTLTNWSLTHFDSWGFYRGSDIEIGYGVETDCTQHLGKPGFRLFRNTPKVTSIKKPTIEGVDANVWVHDNYVCTGDGGLQISQGDSGSIWGSDGSSDADGVVYDNNTVFSTTGPCILIGTGNERGSFPFIFVTKNFVFRNTHCTSGTTGITEKASDQGQIIGGIIKTIDIDNTFDQTGTPTVFVSGSNGGTVNGTLFDGLTISNALLFDFRADSGSCNITLQNSTLNAPRTPEAQTIQLRGDCNTKILSNTIHAPAGGNAIQAGPNNFVSTSPTMTGNQIFDVPDTRSAILLGNSTGATLSANIFHKATGATKSRGTTLASAGSSGPGTTHATETGDDMSRMDIPYICTPNGGTNALTGNTGGANTTC